MSNLLIYTIAAFMFLSAIMLVCHARKRTAREKMNLIGLVDLNDMAIGDQVKIECESDGLVFKYSSSDVPYQHQVYTAKSVSNEFLNAFILLSQRRVTDIKNYKEPARTFQEKF